MFERDSTAPPTTRRRALLAAGATSFAAVAGCLDSGSGGDGDDGNEGGDDDSDGTTSGTTTESDPGKTNQSEAGETGGNDTDGENGSGGDGGEPTAADVFEVTDIAVAGEGGEGTILATGSGTVTATVRNPSDTPLFGTVALSLDGERVATQQVRVLDDATATADFEAIGGDLTTAGDYPVTVSVVDGDGTEGSGGVSGTLTVSEATELSVTVRLESADGPRGGGGELWAFPGGAPIDADGLARAAGTIPEQNLPEPFARTEIAEDGTATIRTPADADRVGLVVAEPGGGVFPPATQEVAVTGATPRDVEIVAGYPTQGADSFRFTTYSYDSGDERDWHVWGIHADGDHYTREIRPDIGPRGVSSSPQLTLEDRPVEWGADLVVFVNERKVESNHWVKLDDQRYWKTAANEPWETSENDHYYSPTYPRHKPALSGLAALTNLETERQTFLRRETLGDTTVDVYRIDPEAFDETEVYPDNEVFVDPETGYVVRVEHDRAYTSEGELLTDGYGIAEFTRHGEIGTLNLGQFDVIDSPV